MNDRTTDLSRSVALGEGAVPTTTPALVILHTPDPGAGEALVALERPLTIGRNDVPGIDLGLHDSRISRRHATVRPRSDRSGLEFEDHGSRNGTYVDGRRSAAGFVPAGGVLRMGDTIFAVSNVPQRKPSRPRPQVVGRSARILEAIAACETFATSPLPVLLLGETGTGKEVFARLTHELSGRRGPFVTLNCAAIPRDLIESSLFGHKKGAFTGADSDRVGYFAQAEGGTLFLDEIGELLPDLQAKLLRVLENHEYSPVGSTATMRAHVRVVSATNAEL